MFNLARDPKVRKVGYVLLKVFQACNIVTLLTVVSASWVMIVMTGMKNQFYFFDAATHFFVSSWALVLVGSELQFGLIRRYYERNWPVFGPTHSFFWLGMMMVVLGCNMLGNLNKPAFTVDNLGLPMWRLVLAAGILPFIFGLVNLASSVIFRDGKAGVTARMIRNDGVVAEAKMDQASFDQYSAPSQMEDSRLNRVTQYFKKSPFSGTKKPQISKPIPHDQDDLEQGSHGHDDWSEELARPPTAMHPAMRTGGSSHYSVANMDRF